MGIFSGVTGFLGDVAGGLTDITFGKAGTGGPPPQFFAEQIDANGCEND